MSRDDNVIRKNKIDTFDETDDDYGSKTSDRFRTYRGKYPREGYKRGDDPFRIPKDERKPPPMR